MWRSGFLINKTRPQLAPRNTFTVGEGAVQVVAAGLVDAETVDFEVLVTSTAPDGVERWVPLRRKSRPVFLSRTHNVHVELIAGVYRVSSLSAGAVVYYYERADSALIDGRVRYSSFQGAA